MTWDLRRIVDLLAFILPRLRRVGRLCLLDGYGILCVLCTKWAEKEIICFVVSFVSL